MRAYRVTLGAVSQYAGSMADAKQVRYALNEAAGKPRTAYSEGAAQIEEVEIPTNKDGLLGFINDLIKKG